MEDTATPAPSQALAADMLRINLEASIRCGKAGEPRLTAYHSRACAASWATFRLLDRLRTIDPDGADTFTAGLIEELNDADYLDEVGDYAAGLGVDVDELVDRVHAEFEPTAA